MTQCGLSLDQYRAYGGRLGDGTLIAHAETGMAIAWAEVEKYLSANIVPGTGTYRALWPQDDLVPLDKFYLRDLIEIKGYHDNGTCDASMRNYVEAGLVVSAKQSVINIRSCHGGWSSCLNCTGGGSPMPIIVEVTYTSGVWDSVDVIPPNAMAGIMLLARWEAKQLTGEEDLGAPEAQSFSNNGYNESRAPVPETFFGTSYAAARAEKLLRPYKVKRMIRTRPTVNPNIIPRPGGQYPGNTYRL